MKKLTRFVLTGGAWVLLLLFPGVAVPFVAVAGVFAPPEDRVELRLLIRSDIPCVCQSADIYQPLAESIARFEKAYGAHISLSDYQLIDFEKKLFSAFSAVNPPHVIWAEASVLPMLVRHDWVAPIKASEMEYGETSDLFVYMGELYGLPLGYEGQLSLNGYLITRAAEKDGVEEMARALVDHLRREIPLRGLPDLAVDRVEIKKPGRERRLAGRSSQRATRRIMASAYITNLGEADTDRAAVTMQYGREIQTRIIRNIRVDTTRKVKFEVLLDGMEPQPLVVTVDMFDEVQEDNETNNEIYETLFDVPNWPGPYPLPPTPSAQGAPFVIDVEADSAHAAGMGPRVAFDGQNYFVVWAKQIPPSPSEFSHELWATRIQPDGTIMDPGGFMIATGAPLFSHVEMAHDGGNVFLIVWERNQVYLDPLAAPTSTIEGVRVIFNGSTYTLSPLVIEASTTPAAYNRIGHSYPDVFFDGADFRVVYQSMVKYSDDLNDIVNAQSGIYMKRVPPLSGSATDKQALVLFGSNVTGLRLQATYSQGKGLLVFSGLTANDTVTGKPAIWSRWFTLTGGLNVSQPLLPVVTDPSGNDVWPYRWPVVAGVEPDFVAVWEDETLLATPARSGLSAAYGFSIAGTSTGWVMPSSTVIQACHDWKPRIAFNNSEFTVVDAHLHG